MSNTEQNNEHHKDSNKKINHAWYKEKEAAKTSRPIFFTLWCMTHFPKWFLNIVIRGNAIFFYIFNRRARIASKNYQRQLTEFYSNDNPPRQKPLRELACFAFALVEKIDSWTGKNFINEIHFHDDDVSVLKNQLNEGKGAFIFVSHLGNSEVLRCLANSNIMDIKRKIQIAVLADMNITSNFANALNTMNPHFLSNIVDVNSITPATIEHLASVVASGGLVICAGDRISKTSKSKYISENFLGKPAPFSYGAFLLPFLLSVPAFFIFGFKKNELHTDKNYEFFAHKAKTQTENVARKNRDQNIKALCHEFKDYLEKYCRQYPYQWYNFFDFWEFPDTPNQE